MTMKRRSLLLGAAFSALSAGASQAFGLNFGLGRLGRTSAGGSNVIPFPSGFWPGAAPNWSIVKSGLSTYSQSGAGYTTTVNFAALKPTPTYTYYVSAAGSTSASPANNDPNTPVSFIRMITLAQARGGDIRAFCSNDIYWQTGFGSAPTSNITSLIIEPWVGHGTNFAPCFVIRNITASSAPVWTPDTGTTYVSPFAGAQALANCPVFDIAHLDAGGCPPRLTAAADLATCRTTPGSTFFDSGGAQVYVNPIDGRNLVGDQTMLVLSCGRSMNINRSANLTVWMDGIYWFGNMIVTTSAHVGVTISFNSRNCGFFGSLDDNGGLANAFNVTGRVDCIHLSPRQGGAARDGMNYHGDASGSPTFLEWDMRSIRNGYESGGTANNCSTCHEDSRGVRVSGYYASSQNRTIHDIGSAKTFNVGIDVKPSLASDSTAQTIVSGILGGDTSSVYINDTTVEHSANADLAVLISGCSIFYKNMSIVGLTTFVQSGGQIAAY